jgi:hypothetical protein
MSAVEILAKSAESQKSGPIGLAVILVLCIACYFLFKSMSKHLKHVREEFPADAAPTPRPASASSAPAAVVLPVETRAASTDDSAGPPEASPS